MKTDVGVDEKMYPPFKVAAVLDALKDEGLSEGEVVRELGLSRAETSSPETRVSLNQVLKAYGVADRMSANPHFAYHAGQRLHVSAYGMYGFAILSSMNYRQTMKFGVEYHQLATPVVECEFSEAGGCANWTFAPAPKADEDARIAKFTIEMQFGILISLFRDVMGPEFAPRELRVTFAPPDDAAHYPELFGAPVMFGQPKNAMQFDSVWLDGTPKLGNEISYRTVHALCDAMIGQLQLRTGLAGKLRRYLMANLLRPIRLDDAAEVLNLSPRTVRRKLGEENTSFREIVDELRMEMAVRYLRETRLSVEDIAELLGFSDAANFRHAFRRWTKVQPSAYRGRLKGNQGSETLSGASAATANFSSSSSLAEDNPLLAGPDRFEPPLRSYIPGSRHRGARQ